MQGGRGRRLAICSAFMGLVVVVATGIALADWIREEYWILRLRHCHFELDRVDAALRLGKMRSVRAVPEVLRAYDRLPPLRGAGYDSPRLMKKALVEIGESALPALVSSLADDLGTHRWLAAEVIPLVLKPRHPETASLIGPHADGGSLKDILEVLCADQELADQVRVAAAEALKKIDRKKP